MLVSSMLNDTVTTTIYINDTTIVSNEDTKVTNGLQLLSLLKSMYDSKQHITKIINIGHDIIAFKISDMNCTFSINI